MGCSHVQGGREYLALKLGVLQNYNKVSSCELWKVIYSKVLNMIHYRCYTFKNILHKWIFVDNPCMK